MPDALRIYNLFPLLAGTIGDWRSHLPRIAAMGFDTVYVNPFHYPGFSGSLYAVKDYYRLNPIFRGGAPDTESDDELLAGFAAAAAEHGLRVMMDLVVNHTSKDSLLVAEHPDWFVRGADGEIRSPRAIDPANPSDVTVWGDLAELDYRRRDAREGIVGYFADVVRHYVGLGFTGFRCDAAYQVPGEAWRAMIEAGRAVRPDLVFCAETLGAQPDQVHQLAEAGFDYLFNSVKWWDFRSPWLLDQYEAYRRIAPSIGFPESHDTDRLIADLGRAGVSDPHEIEARYRFLYAFSAAFSAGVMMPMGYEFGWSRRVDVVETRPEHAGEEEMRFDLSPFIAAVNRLKNDVPALAAEGPQELLTTPGDPVVALSRRTEDGSGEWAFILANTDPFAPREVDTDALLAAAGPANIALSDATPEAGGDVEPGLHIELAPLQVRVLRGRQAVARHPVVRGDRGAAGAVDTAAAGGKPAAAAATTAEGVHHHPAWSPCARIAIEDVWPEIDAGRFPVKRVVGDTVEVWADIFRDGHDKIAAAVKYRTLGDAEWREAPMEFVDNDRWTGRFTVEENARYVYAIEAWTDVFASWRDEVRKKRDAGQDIGLELMEGRTLLVRARERAAADEARRLDRVLAEFDETEGDQDARADLMLSRLVQDLMVRCDDRADATRYREIEIVVDRPAAQFAAWYEMFQRSQGTDPARGATFDDCIRRLPYVRDLGFDVVYLVPIHPIGRTNRKGRDNTLNPGPDDPGSPYAIGGDEGGHKAVHPELGTLDDFRRFVAAAHQYGLEVALDFAVQASPDHPWLREHREWFVVRPDGTIKYAENPPKKYQDIVNVDFYNPARQSLWDELRDTLLFWVEQGVKTFRVDNPHTKPVPFWEWCIREVQERHPDVIFLSEAFTRPKMMRLLAKAGFTQSYSYFTWRNTKQELTDYLTELTQGTSKEYLRPNFFTNTPDILPTFLQEGGRPAFRIRFVLAATLAGAYGIYNGYELCENAAIPGKEEYLHSEKYEYKVWDWDRPGNIKDDIAKLNFFRRENPALHLFTNLRFYPAWDDNVLFYGKMTPDRSNMVFCAVNVDPHAMHEATIEFPLQEMGIGDDEPFEVFELFSGRRHVWRGARQWVRLDPDVNPAAVFRVSRPTYG